MKNNAENFWNLYHKTQNCTDDMQRLLDLLQCAQQEEDIELARLAQYQAALMVCQGRGIEQNEETAKSMMEISATQGYPPAMSWLGKKMTDEGNAQGFPWLRMAVSAGGELEAAQELSKWYMSGRTGGSASICRAVEKEVQILAQESLDKINNGDDEDGLPELCLAYIGLYDLGSILSFTRENGQLFLQQSCEKGNQVARRLVENPTLQRADSWALMGVLAEGAAASASATGSAGEAAPIGASATVPDEEAATAPAAAIAGEAATAPAAAPTLNEAPVSRSAAPESGPAPESEPAAQPVLQPVQKKDGLTLLIVSAIKGALLSGVLVAILDIEFPLPFLLGTAFFWVWTRRKEAKAG